MIYIERDGTVKEYFTSPKTEKVIQSILECPNSFEESIPWCTKFSTIYTVLILTKDDKRDLLLAKERGVLSI